MPVSSPEIVDREEETRARVALLEQAWAQIRRHHPEVRSNNWRCRRCMRRHRILRERLRVPTP
jgi:hypothetical protein